jgi:hypothetical protein
MSFGSISTRQKQGIQHWHFRHLWAARFFSVAGSLAMLSCSQNKDLASTNRPALPATVESLIAQETAKQDRLLKEVRLKEISDKDKVVNQAVKDLGLKVSPNLELAKMDYTVRSAMVKERVSEIQRVSSQIESTPKYSPLDKEKVRSLLDSHLQACTALLEQLRSQLELVYKEDFEYTVNPPEFPGPAKKYDEGKP